ncbi:hypothetical protein [Streptomyces sp. NPDC046685]|uniref:hypothetical protein n=1 Tax=Streptomyces sp. NPDC046685 TaxID=3157202 RepID=UPI0033CA4CB4
MHQQVAGSNRETWQLDANHRFRSWKTESYSGSAWAQTGVKTHHYDSDGGNPRWIAEDLGSGALTRNVDSAHEGRCRAARRCAAPAFLVDRSDAVHGVDLWSSACWTSPRRSWSARRSR